MKMNRTLLAAAVALLLTPFSPALGAVTDLQTIVSAQNPTQWLKFSNNLNNSGSGSATFDPVPPSAGLGFGADADGAANSAASYTSNLDEIATLTDVIANAGSLSLIFRMPDLDFTGDRYLFDGGEDTGDDNDGFALRWDDGDVDAGYPDGVMQVKMGNTTMRLNGPYTDGGFNVEEFNGQWIYFGMSWDDSLSTEGTAYIGALGGTLYSTVLNPANASFMGDGANFSIGNQDFSTRSWRQFESEGDIPGSGTGYLDEFAIWEAALEPGQLVAQFNYLNGNAPPPPTAGVIADGFDDGSRSIEPDGINWYAIGGLTTTPPVKQKPGLTVQPDPTGINDGNALFVEAIGTNNEVMGNFGEEVALGATNGSTLSVTFDFRLQTSPTVSGELRFGIYADIDNQFGMNGWGESDGAYDKSSPGALGDAGIFARVQLGTDPLLNGSETRIVSQETVDDIIGGGGTDTIVQAEPGGFGVIDDTGTYSFELLLTRVAPDGVTNETVMATLKMDDGTTISTLSGIDSTFSTTEINAADIFEYFVAKTTVDVDWVLDNFRVEAMGPTSTPGDFDGDGDVDGRDFLIWQRGGAPGGSTPANLQAWQQNYGTPLAAALGAVPEPSTLLLLGCAASCLLFRNKIR